MTFKEFINEAGWLKKALYTPVFTGNSNNSQTVDKMFETIKKDIVNILSNLAKSQNNFLGKLNYDYANILREFYRSIPHEDQQSPQQQQGGINQAGNTTAPIQNSWTTHESWGGWLGAAAGAAMGGPVGAAAGAALGHYGSKAINNAPNAINYMKPENMQLRQHISLEKVLLNHLKELSSMLENARDPQTKQILHSGFTAQLNRVITNLEKWQEYYKNGGTGELYKQ